MLFSWKINHIYIPCEDQNIVCTNFPLPECSLLCGSFPLDMWPGDSKIREHIIISKGAEHITEWLNKNGFQLNWNSYSLIYTKKIVAVVIYCNCPCSSLSVCLVLAYVEPDYSLGRGFKESRMCLIVVIQPALAVIIIYAVKWVMDTRRKMYCIFGTPPPYPFQSHSPMIGTYIST